MAINRIMLSEAIDGYLAAREMHCSPSTVANERSFLRRVLHWYGDVQIRNVRADRVHEFFSTLNEDHRTRDGQLRHAVQPTSFNYYRSRLDTFFKHCISFGWLRDNPLRLVARRKTTTGDRLILNPTQMYRLIESGEDERDRAYLATACNTGLRSGELARLRVADVDLNKNVMRVEVTKSRLVVEQPITTELHDHLVEWLAIYSRSLSGDAERQPRPLHQSDYLFPARAAPEYIWVEQPDGTKTRAHGPRRWKPDRPITKSERVVHFALRALGLPTLKEGTHTLRRSAARALFDLLTSEDGGYDAALRTVSAFLHHKSTQTTEHYLGLSSEKARLDKRLRGGAFLSLMLEPDAEVVTFRPALVDLGSA